MAIYKPYIKKSNGAIDELPLYATTAGEVVNLGYYDTISENSDGTYTITRQTGYLTINSEDITSSSNKSVNSANAYTYVYYNKKVSDALYDWDAIIGISNNGFEVKCLDSDWIKANKISINSTGKQICLGFETAKTQVEIQALCPIYVQYKLATATTEKVEKNHYARYNERFILEHNKSEAEKSANLVDYSKILNNHTLNAYGELISYDGYFVTDFIRVEPNKTYTMSNSHDGSLYFYDKNKNFVEKVVKEKAPVTYTIDSNVYYIRKSSPNTYTKIMINEGSVALPYQPYEGKVIHQKELKNNSSNYATLGYYDTISENSDGTYTITRQTGYLVLDGVKNKFNAKFDNTRNGEYYYNELINYISRPSSPSIIGSIISNTLKTLSADDLYIKNTYGIAVDARGYILVGLTTAVSTLDDANAWLLQNPISIQYKLATATTEKVEKNHYARYNERFILEHNETEAERSTNLWDEITESGTLSGDDGSLENNSARLRSKNFIPISGNTRYIFNSSYVARINFYGSTFNFISTWVNNKTPFVTPSNAYFIKFDINSDYGTTYKNDIILNKGSVALPYQPYNQSKHITNNEAAFLKNEAEKSANLFDIHTVTIGKGYDYTVTATDWIKAIDIPVEPNTTYTASYPIARYAFNHGNIVADYNKNTITTGRDTTTLSLFMYVGDYSGTVNAWFSNYMLNEGPIALPYQPYEGKVIHEKDLKNASTNLGYYDTITENADGSYTITKQTGYVNGKDFLYWGMNGAGNRYVTFNHIKANRNIENIIGNCDRVGPDSWWQSTFSKVTITYDGNNDFLIILLPYGTAENDSNPLNDIHVQYKLPNVRTEIVEKNYCAQYNKRFILEHNKIEAAKSSNLWSYENSITINAGSEKWWYLSNSTMDAWGLVVGETYSIKSFVNSATKDLSFQILPSYSDFRNGKSFVFTSDTQIRIGGNTVSSPVTFTPKISLVKGIDIADEYQPYVGRIIHKKDLDNLPKLYNHFVKISFKITSGSSSITYNCRVNILSTVKAAVTSDTAFGDVCKTAKNISQSISNNIYYWSMPAEGIPSTNETSVSAPNFTIFRLLVYYSDSGDRIFYLYNINRAGSFNFEVVNSYSATDLFFSDTVTTIYGG